MDEISATLDDDGCVDGLPFMPEMVRYVGRRYRVRQVAERTCVHPPVVPFPRLSGCVTLEALRCDGSAHGDCQLGCLLLFKEVWLRRVDGPGGVGAGPPPGGVAVQPPGGVAVQPPGGVAVQPPVRAYSAASRNGTYRCQATELPRATSPGLPLWQPLQYVGFVRNGTFRPTEVVAMFARMGLRRGRRLLRRGARLREHDFASVLHLEPGEWVTVRSQEEIARTLDASGRLGGLAFGGDMAGECGRTLQVERRVERIMDERTGQIRTVKDTVLLQGSFCDRYLGCARGMPILWREAWLRRADGSA